MAQEVIQLYANLLTEEACWPWEVIVKEQMESLLYTDIYGVKHKKLPDKAMDLFGHASCFTFSHVAQIREEI